MNFSKASFNSKLIQTPVVGQFTHKTTPADGREKWSAAPLVHRFLWRKSGLWLEGVNASAVWRKVRAPPPSPAPPPGVLYRVTVSGGLGLRRTDHRDGCLKKNRLFKRSSFDKRWLKYTVRMEDCTYLCFKDDYRVCVKKRNFYRPPSAARMWRRMVRSGEPRRRLSHWSTRSLLWRRERPGLAEMSVHT